MNLIIPQKSETVERAGRKRGIAAMGTALPGPLASDRIHAMTTRSITLRDEHESLIQQALKSGRFLSESEVVAEALSEFQVHEEIRRAKFAELKAKIQVGIDQLDRGETVEFNLAEFLAARHAEHAAC